MNEAADMTTAPIPSRHANFPKLPGFWRDRPRLWFSSVEALFHISHIEDSQLRFFYVVAALPQDALTHVADIIEAPPTSESYPTLKKRLLDSFSETEGQQLRRLLTGLSLGDRRPSALLWEMKELACGKFSNDVLQCLWLQQLPLSLQSILTVSTEPLERLAEMADKIHDVSRPSSASSIAALSTSGDGQPELQLVTARLAAVEEQISHLTAEIRRRPLARISTRPPSRVAVSSGGVCFYHRRFGTAARKCTLPCSMAASRDTLIQASIVKTTNDGPRLSSRRLTPLCNRL